MTEHAQFVTLGVAEEIFAVPVGSVQEILETLPITPLPQAPANLLGMVDVRGQTVPVVDLRLTLGLPAREDTQSTRIVVLSLGGPSGQQHLGVRTDRVFEVTELDDGAIEPPATLNGQWTNHGIVGIGRRKGAFVTVVDFSRMIGGIVPH